jgi:hypothetical protein
MAMEADSPSAADYWTLPIPPQGTPPAGLSPLEASLKPEDCGSCHSEQFKAWKNSLHAGAMSPGVRGQILSSLSGESEPEFGTQCLTCHAPMSEQSPFVRSGAGQGRRVLVENPDYDVELQDRGVVCASCHLRNHRRFGPPPREPSAVRSADSLPHGGFTVSSLFRDAAFCAPCHQHSNDFSANAKPIMNTYNEWRASPYADRGTVCQDCHMPERQHLWRGIHDPEQVRKAITTQLRLVGRPSASRIQATFRVTNSGAGHFFPTYVTPAVFLKVYQVDASGQPIRGTLQSSVLRREVAFDEEPPREISDTRLAPGESFALAYSEARAHRASSIVAEVVVSPDNYYIGLYESLLSGSSLSPRDRDLLQSAYDRALSSSFSATRDTLPLK